MYCANCGVKLGNKDKFCTHCGWKPESQSDHADPIKDINDVSGEVEEHADIDNPSITDSDATGNTPEWYDTGWAWGWVFLFWPVAIYAFYKRNNGEHRKALLIIIAVSILSVLLDTSGLIKNRPITKLTKSAAADACSNRFLNSSLMANPDVEFERQVTVKTGDNEFSSIMYYSDDGYPRGFNCESIYLRDGKIWTKVFK